MSSPNPQPVVSKAGGYTQEPNTFSSINDLYKFFAPLTIRVSKNSPPGLTDVNEMQFCFDKAALRLWIKVDGTLRFVQFT